jgi:hypothetical protein
VETFNFSSLWDSARRTTGTGTGGTAITAKRRWFRWVCGAVGLVLTVGFVVPFVYIRFIRPTPPPPFSFEDLNDDAKLGGGPKMASLPSEWSAVQPSSAGYVLVARKDGKNRRLTGVTPIASGSFTQLNGVVQRLEMDFDLASVGSDDPARDRVFRDVMTQAGEYPVASFTLTDPTIFSLPQRQGRVSAPGVLSIAGDDRTVEIELSFRWIRDHLEVVGTTEFVWRTWGVPDPFSVGEPLEPPLLEFALTFVPTPREHRVTGQG